GRGDRVGVEIDATVPVYLQIEEAGGQHERAPLRIAQRFASSEAAGGSRKITVLGCSCTIEAGWRLLVGPSSASRTAGALRASGTDRMMRSLFMIWRMLIEIAR